MLFTMSSVGSAMVISHFTLRGTAVEEAVVDAGAVAEEFGGASGGVEALHQGDDKVGKSGPGASLVFVGFLVVDGCLICVLNGKLIYYMIYILGIILIAWEGCSRRLDEKLELQQPCQMFSYCFHNSEKCNEK
jgi:hypothetical protein